MPTKVTVSYAYFSGTGPAGETCGRCQHFTFKSGKPENPKHYCAKAAEFIGSRRPTEAISGASAACKYFVKRDGAKTEAA